VNRKIIVVIACALWAGSASAAQNAPRKGVIIHELETMGTTTQAAPQKGTSDADKLEASAEHLARMKTSLKQVLARVEEARNEKDVVKLNCVNEKLTQIKALLKVAEQADIALHEAISNRDPGAESEFSKIGIARTKVEGLRGESEQCIGQLAYVVDEKTTVEVQQPALPDGEDDDARARERRRRGPPFPPPPIVRPPPASPFN
jgi:hypothetical protein